MALTGTAKDVWQIRDTVIATPENFGEVEYRYFCELANLLPTSDGYGLAIIENQRGERRTQITLDLDYVRLLQQGVRGEVDSEIPTGKFTTWIAGWPTDWIPGGAQPPRPGR